MPASLSRRSLFALPVALPLAVVAVPAARAKVRTFDDIFIRGSWVGGSALDKIRLPFTFDYKWESGAVDPYRRLGGALMGEKPPAFTDAEMAATLGIEHAPLQPAPPPIDLANYVGG